MVVIQINTVACMEGVMYSVYSVFTTEIRTHTSLSVLYSAVAFILNSQVILLYSSHKAERNGLLFTGTYVTTTSCVEAPPGSCGCGYKCVWESLSCAASVTPCYMVLVTVSPVHTSTREDLWRYRCVHRYK